MQSKTKIIAVNIPIKLSEKLMTDFLENQFSVTMVDNLYSHATATLIEQSHIVILNTDDNLYSAKQLASFCQSNPFVEVVGIVRNDNDEKHQFIQAGLFDIITNDCSQDELKTILLRAVKAQKNKTEISRLKQYVAMNFGFDNLIGNSKQMLQLKEKVKNVSPTDIAVHLNGPSGSGKSITAKVIHHHSERRKQPLLTIDLSATSESMIDELLFGTTDSPENALLFKANNGTLFIKNIHLIPNMTQQRLIRFFHTNKLNNAPNCKKLSVRFLSASGMNLNSLVNAGTFERELYHLIGEITITIPHLKERLDDVESLAEYFARKVSHESDRQNLTFSRSALELLYNHHWSENVRELENIIKRAATLCRTSQIEEHDILFIESGLASTSPNRFTVDMTADQGNGILDEGQRSLIVKTLNTNNWNFTQTAQELGIGRTTLWRKVKKYNLKKESAELV